MNTTFYALENTTEYLKGLNIHPELNAFWELIHIIRWHKGIDWIMWIDKNKNLISEIITYKSKINLPEDLKKRIWDSINEIKELDR